MIYIVDFKINTQGLTSYKVNEMCFKAGIRKCPTSPLRNLRILSKQTAQSTLED